MSWPYTIENCNAAAGVGRRGFPHMSVADSIVWRTILDEGLFPAQKYDYDVQLGGAGSPFDDPADQYEQMWSTLMKKRVDVVAWLNNVPFLIEVKPLAGFSALGQLLGYEHLWQEEKGDVPEVGKVAACINADPDLVRTFERYHVRVVSVPSSIAPAVWEEIALARRPRAS